MNPSFSLPKILCSGATLVLSLFSFSFTVSGLEPPGLSIRPGEPREVMVGEEIKRVTDSVILSWDATPGHGYEVLSAETIDGEWQPLNAEPLAAEAETLEHPVAGLTGPRFFQIRDIGELVVDFIDLTASVGEAFAPERFHFAGDNVEFNLPLEVHNLGNIALPENETISVTVNAINLMDASVVELDVIENLSVGGLEPAGIAVFELSTALPENLSGQYQLQVDIDSSGLVAESDEENNSAMVPLEQTISLVDDFLGFAHYDVPGASWTYSGFLDSNVAGGNGTLNSSIRQLSGNRYVLNEIANTNNGDFEQEEQSLTWQRTANGTMLLEQEVEVDLGEMTISYGNLLFWSAALEAGQTHNDTSPVEVAIRVFGQTIRMNGEATVRTRFRRFENVSFDGKSHRSARIDYTIDLEVAGTYNGFDLSMSYEMFSDLKAVPGIGVVSSDSSDKVSLTITGEGTDSASGTGGRDLITYNIP